MVIWRRYNVREGGTLRERGLIEVVQSSTMTVGHIIDPGRERDNKGFLSNWDLNT
jgi:hypothetical protein